MKFITSLGAKLSLALGASFGLVVAVALFGLAHLNEANENERKAQEIWSPRVEMLRELNLFIDQTSLLITRQLQTTNFRHLAEIAGASRATEAKIDAVVSAYKATVQVLEEERLIGLFVTRWAVWRDAHQDILQHLEAGEILRATQMFEVKSKAAFNAADRSLDELIGFAQSEKRIASLRAEQAHDQALTQALAAIALGALLAAATVIWVRHHISVPILKLAVAMRQLATGDLTVTSRWAQRQDEIGVLAAAVAGYRDSLARGQLLAEAAEAERQRLEAAVTNMPIGLCMFDGSSRLVVSNERFEEIYGLSSKSARPGISLPELLTSCSNLADGAAGLDAMTHFLSASEQCASSRGMIELTGGRMISIIHQPLPDGGWVATHEDVTERRRAEAQVAHMANHDALTDLPNRVLFRKRMEEALALSQQGNRVAVLCLDLDRFKLVNDTLGHPIGDALLRAVTERLQAQIRETDLIARLGGDEFAIIQPSTNHPSDAASLARRLVDVMSQPFELEGHQVVIGTSVGIAMTPGDDHSNDADTLLRNADLALYRAKADGRGIWRFFEIEMDAHMQSRRQLELDLRRALAMNEFDLFYQPIIDLRSGGVSSFEALLRWHHPERGLVMPGEFIPLAEEIGLIVPIGEWVLLRACSDAATWPAHPKLAVNLSAAQFAGRGPVPAVIAALKLSGLEPARLELEITETVVLDDTERTLCMLRDLKALGVSIAMDDFGAGYCSLNYLRKFPFDRVKIDRSFIEEIDQTEGSTAVVRAIVDLCDSLGMVVTAEGIETEEQLLGLRGMCIGVQGYLFSPPRPAMEVPALCQFFNLTKELKVG
jgi:diguanylate cyclase (GGDEF)-like protein